MKKITSEIVIKKKTRNAKHSEATNIDRVKNQREQIFKNSNIQISKTNVKVEEILEFLQKFLSGS